MEKRNIEIRIGSDVFKHRLKTGLTYIKLAIQHIRYGSSVLQITNAKITTQTEADSV